MASRVSLRGVLSALGAAAGVVHLLFPERLLATAAWAYDLVLAVDFDPRERATRRVRLVGLLFLAASLFLAVRSAD